MWTVRRIVYRRHWCTWQSHLSVFCTVIGKLWKWVSGRELCQFEMVWNGRKPMSFRRSHGFSWKSTKGAPWSIRVLPALERGGLLVSERHTGDCQQTSPAHLWGVIPDQRQQSPLDLPSSERNAISVDSWVRIEFVGSRTAVGTCGSLRSPPCIWVSLPAEAPLRLLLSGHPANWIA
jgi:hypothetical protein